MRPAAKAACASSSIDCGVCAEAVTDAARTKTADTRQLRIDNLRTEIDDLPDDSSMNGALDRAFAQSLNQQ
jgi:hypothetical protein